MFTLKRRMTLITSVLFLTLILSLLFPSIALADGETPPPPPEAPVVDAAPTEEPVVDLAPTEVPVVDVPPTESVSDVVAALADANAVLLDADGNPIPLASQEAADSLAAPDPYIVRAGVTHRFLTSCTGQPVDATNTCTESSTPIQAAINFAIAGETVYVEAGTYLEGRIVIDKNLTIVGDSANKPVIQPNVDITGRNAGDAWILVNSGVTFSLSDVVLNGAGYNVAQALRNHGDTTIDHVDFQNIWVNNDPYTGFAVGSYGGVVPGGLGSDSHGGDGELASTLSVQNSTFVNIGRVGVIIKGTESNAEITGNTYTGKGDGVWLDYAFEVGAGGQAAIDGNTISDNTGLASDGSTSAGILVTDYYGTGTEATITGNTITGNTTGIAIGYDDDDASVVEITGNTFADNDIQIEGTNDSLFDVDETLDGNTFDQAVTVDHPGSSLLPTIWSSIQDSVDAASSGDTVNVMPGTYAGNITINKSVTLTGDPGDANAGPGSYAPVIDGGSTVGSAFFIANGVSDVTIQGFEMSNFINGTGNGEGNGISAWEASTSNITIQDNYFHNLGWNAVLVGNDGALGDHTGWTTANNVLEDYDFYGFELTNASNSSIENNIIHASNSVSSILVVARRDESGITIKNNQIDGSIASGSDGRAAIYVLAWDQELPSPNLDALLIEGNDISTTGDRPHIRIYDAGGTVTGVQVYDNSLSTLTNQTAGLIDASGNWWGTNDSAGIAGSISGDVDYTPWLNSGTDTSVNPGFQGDFSVLNVDDDSPQTGGTGYIQEAVDLVTGSTVNMMAGTYTEDVEINGKDGFTLQGAGSSNTTITGSVAAYSNTGTLTLRNFAVTGSTGFAGIDVGPHDGQVVLSGIVSSNGARTGTFIQSSGAVTVSDSQFSNSTDPDWATGLYITSQGGGPVTLNNVVAAGNSDDGIDIYTDGNVTLNNVTSTNNGYDGVWIYGYDTDWAGTVTVNGGTFTGNGDGTYPEAYGLDIYACQLSMDGAQTFGGNQTANVFFGQNPDCVPAPSGDGGPKPIVPLPPLAPAAIAETAPVTLEDLPGPLPEGKTFLAGMNVTLLLNGESVDEALGGVQVAFDIPEDAVPPFTILFWDGTGWVVIPSTVVDGQVVFTVTQPGVYVLVAG
ncbi:MAG: right-handed parallel beta-helix repeat-containing protein [Anaerolineales bacterium]